MVGRNFQEDKPQKAGRKGEGNLKIKYLSHYPITSWLPNVAGEWKTRKAKYAYTIFHYLYIMKNENYRING